MTFLLLQSYLFSVITEGCLAGLVILIVLLQPSCSLPVHHDAVTVKMSNNIVSSNIVSNNIVSNRLINIPQTSYISTNSQEQLFKMLLRQLLQLLNVRLGQETTSIDSLRHRNRQIRSLLPGKKQPGAKHSDQRHVLPQAKSPSESNTISSERKPQMTDRKRQEHDHSQKSSESRPLSPENPKVSSTHLLLPNSHSSSASSSQDSFFSQRRKTADKRRESSMPLFEWLTWNTDSSCNENC